MTIKNASDDSRCLRFEQLENRTMLTAGMHLPGLDGPGGFNEPVHAGALVQQDAPLSQVGRGGPVVRGPGVDGPRVDDGPSGRPQTPPLQGQSGRDVLGPQHPSGQRSNHVGRPPQPSPVQQPLGTPAAANRPPTSAFAPPSPAQQTVVLTQPANPIPPTSPAVGLGQAPDRAPARPAPAAFVSNPGGNREPVASDPFSGIAATNANAAEGESPIDARAGTAIAATEGGNQVAETATFGDASFVSTLSRDGLAFDSVTDEFSATVDELDSRTGRTSSIVDSIIDSVLDETYSRGLESQDGESFALTADMLELEMGMEMEMDMEKAVSDKWMTRASRDIREADDSEVDGEQVADVLATEPESSRPTTQPVASGIGWLWRLRADADVEFEGDRVEDGLSEFSGMIELSAEADDDSVAAIPLAMTGAGLACEIVPDDARGISQAFDVADGVDAESREESGEGSDSQAATSSADKVGLLRKAAAFLPLAASLTIRRGRRDKRDAESGCF